MRDVLPNTVAINIGTAEIVLSLRVASSSKSSHQRTAALASFLVPTPSSSIAATFRAEGRKTRNGGEWLQPTVSKILNREKA